jgi:hypothetical protein
MLIEEGQEWVFGQAHAFRQLHRLCVGRPGRLARKERDLAEGVARHEDGTDRRCPASILRGSQGAECGSPGALQHNVVRFWRRAAAQPSSPHSHEAPVAS